MDNAIVFVHRGQQEYAKTVLHMAELTQTIPILWVGDLSSDEYGEHKETTKILDINNYCQNMLSDNDYIHLSNNPREYELFCIQRWYIIRNLMIEQNIENVWAVDSDVLLCSDFNMIKNECESYDICFNGLAHDLMLAVPAVLHTNRQVMNDFCSYCIDMYSNKSEELIDINRQRYNEIVDWPGISDMFLWEQFSRKCKCYDLSLLVDDRGKILRKWIVDSNVRFPDGFEFDYEMSIKKISFIDGIAWGKYIENDTTETIQFIALHFQGTNKNKIPFFARLCSDSLL